MGNNEMVKNPAKGLRLLRTAGILSIVGTIVTIVGAIVAIIGASISVGMAAESETVAAGAIGTAAIATAVALIGGIVALIAGILQFVALIKISGAHAGYKTALYVSVANIIFQAIVSFIPMPAVVTTILSAVAMAVSFVVIYFVITATVDFLNKKGNTALADKGISVRKLYMICISIVVISDLLGLIPALATVIGVIAGIASVVQIVALLKYIGFLGQSANALEG